ncbi:MAG: RluA family pseudouridine synthase [Bacteroidales bacterium]|nr:RluA family pseudouridine synthase [Bacteroidales bacterium]
MSIELEKQILFEDNHIIILNKLSSQIVHSDKTGDVSLEEMVKHYLKTKYNKPGNVYCGLVHRLDRPVSGVVMFAKTEKALVRLNKMMKEHQIHKTYWAIVRNNNIKPKATLVNFLIRNEKQNKTFVTKDTTKGKYAELDYEVLAKGDNYQLLQVNLKTGRHHQIRVQLSNIGCPIKGDLKYGFERSNKDASISLHARQLEFLHPVKKEQIKIIAPLPKDSLWQWFDENISKE